MRFQSALMHFNKFIIVTKYFKRFLDVVKHSLSNFFKSSGIRREKTINSLTVVTLFTEARAMYKL